MTVRRIVRLAAFCAVALIVVGLVRDRIRGHADTPAPPQSALDTSKHDLERAMTFSQPADPAK